MTSATQNRQFAIPQPRKGEVPPENREVIHRQRVWARPSIWNMLADRLAFSLLLGSVQAQEWTQLPPLPDKLGVAGPYAGISNRALLLAGGANFPDKMPWDSGKKAWLDRIWVLELPDGSWKDAGKLPRPLAYGVSLTVDDKVLCLGGGDAQTHTTEVLTMTWKDGALKLQAPANPGPLPVPLAFAAGAADSRGRVYLACGLEEPGEKVASNRVFRADWRAATPKWESLPPLPAEPRLLPVAATDGVTFYVFGGAALERLNGKIARRYLTDAWSYTDQQGWKKLAALPSACVAAPSPAPVTGGGIFLLGGDDGSLTGFSPPAQHPGFPGTTLRYDLAQKTWSKLGKVPAPRATLPTVPWEGSFIFPSGEMRPGVRSAEIWKWTGRPTSPSAK